MKQFLHTLCTFCCFLGGIWDPAGWDFLTRGGTFSPSWPQQWQGAPKRSHTGSDWCQNVLNFSPEISKIVEFDSRSLQNGGPYLQNVTPRRNTHSHMITHTHARTYILHTGADYACYGESPQSGGSSKITSYDDSISCASDGVSMWMGVMGVGM